MAIESTFNIARCAVRVSVVRDEKQSPETQRDDMARWCQRNDYQPVFYVDAEGYRSGRSADRPDFQRLLHDIEQQPTHAIVFWDVSRLARNNELAQWFYNTCKDKRIRLVFVRNGLDFQFDKDDPFVLATSKLLFDVLAGTAEYYSNESSARIRANLARLRHIENKHIGGQVPFGTDRVDGVLVPTERGAWWKIGSAEWVETFWNEEAQQEEKYIYPPGKPGEWKWRGYHDALRRVYELYASGQYGFARTAAMLTAEGYAYSSYKGPRMFGGRDVNRILSMHLHYEGHVVSGIITQPWVSEVEIVKRNVWEPILPLELIHRAVAIRQSRTTTRSAIRSNHRVYELPSLLHCANCDQLLRSSTQTRWRKTKKGKRKHIYYKYCHFVKYNLCDAEMFSTNAETAERVVMEYVIEHFNFDREGEHEYVKQHDPDAVVRHAEHGDAAQKEISKLEYSLAKLKDEYFTPGTVLSRDEFRERVLSIETEIEQLRSKQVPQHVPLIFPDRLSEVLRLAKPEERREYYPLFISAIYYDIDTNEIVRLIPKEWAQPYYTI